jgi:hypothetical protein
MKKYKVIEDGIEYQIIENKGGNKVYHLNGLIHKTDGPAVIYSYGTKQYWLNDKYYPDITSDEEWLLFQIIT